MNTYYKYCPNVFVAKCTEKHGRGDIITMETKHGNQHECEVWNLIGERDGHYFYSITRIDGMNAQKFAEKRAEKLEGYASNAEKRSDQYYEASKEGSDFLSLGEPIKVGHHSEKRHRALIDRNWNRMGKSVEESKKAEEYKSRAEYWEKKAATINLSMPESIEYFEHKLEQAEAHHKGLKEGTIERRHSMSLQYANKDVKDLKAKVEMARKLWK